MKITIKDQLNFRELINYIYENNIENASYFPDLDNYTNNVWVNDYDIEFDDDSCITKDDTWTVEREIEITKDTKLSSALVGLDNNGWFMVYHNRSIKDIKRDFRYDDKTKISTIHLINSDESHVLIYKDGELVE